MVWVRGTVGLHGTGRCGLSVGRSEVGRDGLWNGMRWDGMGWGDDTDAGVQVLGPLCHLFVNSVVPSFFLSV